MSPMDAAPAGIVDRAAPAIDLDTAHIRAVIGEDRTAIVGTAALPATGAVRGVIAAIPRTTAGCQAAAGSNSDIVGYSQLFVPKQIHVPNVSDRRDGFSDSSLTCRPGDGGWIAGLCRVFERSGYRFT